MLSIVSVNLHAAGSSNLIYVAVDGSNNNPGTVDKPVATLAKAKELARKLQATDMPKPIEVIVGGGIYYLDETLTFTPADSGTKTYPITYRAAKDQKVVIRGGKKVVGWKKWKNGIYKADLKAQGLSGIKFHQLFYKSRSAPAEQTSKRQVLARHPNFDPQHPRTGGNIYTKEIAPQSWRQLVYYQGDIPWDKWSDFSQAEVVSTYNRGWMFAITPVLDVDQDKNIITVRPVRNSAGAGRERALGEFIKMNRYFIQNVLDALDSPGEWFLDHKTDELYFYPPDGDIENSQVTIPVVDNIIEFKGTIP